MKKLRAFLPLIILILLMIIAWKFIDITSILAYKSTAIEYANNNLLLKSLTFIFVYFIAVALSLPIATVLTLLAGIIFAPILGTALVAIGATLGAIVVFLVVKHASQSIDITSKYNKSKHLLTLQQNLQKNAASYLLFARLVPLFPFVLVNIAPATVGVKLSTFTWTTLVGILPGSFIYTYLGYQSGQIENIGDLVSIEMLLALTLLGLFSLTPVLIKRIKKHD